MAWSKCAKCNHSFWKAKAYQTKCVVCYKRFRGWKMTGSDEELERIRPMYEARIARQPTHGSLDQSMIRDMIKLCHPDRHKNSDISNSITRWLLEQRKK